MCSKSISRSHSGWEFCDRGGRLWRRCTISKNRSGKKSPFPILRITLHGNSCCNFCATFALGRRLRRSPALELKKDAHSLYILFRNFAFSEQDFWQTFGGYLIALRPKWKIGIFGTDFLHRKRQHCCWTSKTENSMRFKKRSQAAMRTASVLSACELNVPTQRTPRW